MPLEAGTVAALDAYWGEFFGCPPDALARGARLVVPHAALGDYRGIWLFRRGAALIASVPPEHLAACRSAFATLPAAAVDEPELLTGLLPAQLDRVIGPAWLGYRDAGCAPLPESPAARLLTPADAAAYHTFAAAVPEQEWDHGGSPLGDEPLAGAFVGGALVALAGYERWGSAIAHLAVVTLPASRGQGHGAGAVALLAHVAAQRGLIPQYRTLRANGPSMAIACQLGFAPYAEQVAVRLA